jgi:hypothetical protein
MLATQSVAAAYAGQARSARDLTSRALELARSGGRKEAAGPYYAGEALWQAAYGDCRSAKQSVARTLDLTRGREPLSWSALAVALCGESGQAQQLAEEMVRRHPEDSFYKASWLPMIRAAGERRRDPAKAVELLQPAAGSELGTNAALWPAYLRGLAYLDQGAGKDAGAEFQKILDHKGVLAPKDFNPAGITLYPLAFLGRARAARLTGDADESRKAYEALFTLWKSADTDLEVLQAAQREYRQLGTATADSAGQPPSPARTR